MSFRHKSALGSKKKVSDRRHQRPTNLLPTPLNRNQTTGNRLQPSTCSRHPTINSQETTTDTRQLNRKPTPITYRQIPPYNKKRHQTPESC
jgi:hypothetical protein